MNLTARYRCPNPHCEGSKVVSEITMMPPDERILSDGLVCRVCSTTPMARIQDYVVGLHFQANGEHVTLIEKRRPAWQYNKLNGPGGKLVYGETPKEAVSREFKEETDGTIPPDAWRHFATLRLKDGGRVYFLTATRNVNLRTVTDEPVNVYHVAIAGDVGNRLIPNLRFLIPMALHPDGYFAELTEGG